MSVKRLRTLMKSSSLWYLPGHVGKRAKGNGEWSEHSECKETGDPAQPWPGIGCRPGPWALSPTYHHFPTIRPAGSSRFTPSTINLMTGKWRNVVEPGYRHGVDSGRKVMRSMG